MLAWAPLIGVVLGASLNVGLGASYWCWPGRLSLVLAWVPLIGVGLWPIAIGVGLWPIAIGVGLGASLLHNRYDKSCDVPGSGDELS